MNYLLKKDPKNALLVLEDGSVFKGYSCSTEGEAFGYITFETDYSAYEKSICNPDNSGAILAFTFPHIGNVGINGIDSKGKQPSVAAVIVHDMVFTPSNWQCKQSLPAFLCDNGVIAIEGVDTRALMNCVRKSSHALLAAVSTELTDPEELLLRLQAVKEKGGDGNA